MGAVGHRGGEPEAAGRRLAQTQDRLLARARARGGARLVHRDQPQALGMGDQIVEGQMALALGRAQIAERQQPAEPAVGGAILGIGEDVGRAVGEDQPRARHDAQGADRGAVLARIDMGAHDPGERIAVGDAEPGEAEPRRLGDQLLGMRGPAQKREIRRRRQFGEAGLGADHANNPCRNHRARAVSRP